MSLIFLFFKISFFLLFRRGSDDLVSFLNSLIQIHADLHDLLCMIVNIFAIPIILILCQSFFGFCSCSYMFYMSLKDEDSWFSQNMLLIEPTSYIIIFSFQIFIIVVIPSSTTEVANYTGNFLHQMSNERPLGHSLDTVRFIRKITLKKKKFIKIVTVLFSR